VEHGVQMHGIIREIHGPRSPWVSPILCYQEHDWGPFFIAVFLKIDALSQKRRAVLTDQSWCDAAIRSYPGPAAAL
jgi:hypothetical protein